MRVPRKFRFLTWQSLEAEWRSFLAVQVFCWESNPSSGRPRSSAFSQECRRSCMISGKLKIRTSAPTTWSISRKIWRCWAALLHWLRSKSLGRRAYHSHDRARCSVCEGLYGNLLPRKTYSLELGNNHGMSRVKSEVPQAAFCVGK